MSKLFSIFVVTVVLFGIGMGHKAQAVLVIPKDITRYESLISGDVKAAKDYLKTKINRTGRTSCSPHPFTVDNSIDPLNPAFALCAANFMKAYEQSVGVTRISSAFRSPAQQRCVCPTPKAGTCGGAGTYNPTTRTVEGGSNHQRGIALDVNVSDYSKLHEFARINPNFGITFPLGSGDPVHMQPVSRTDPKCVTQNHAINIPTEGYQNVPTNTTAYNPAPITPTQVVTQSLTQQLFASLFGGGQSNSSGGTTLTQSPQVYDNDEDFSTTTISLLGSDLEPLEDIDFLFPTTPEADPEGTTRIIDGNDSLSCEDTYAVGTRSFEECLQNNTTSTNNSAETPSDGVATTIVQKTTTRLAGLIPRLLSGGGDDVYTLNDVGTASRETVTTQGVPIFFDVHNPNSVRPTGGVQNSAPNFVNSTQFLAGETHAVVRETPQIITSSGDFAQLSVLFGAYYGLLHGVSPLIVGSAPRSFVRFGQGNGVVNVYNPFSI